MINKYELTIEQIQDIIASHRLGEFCKQNCYGCCGSDFYMAQCEDCIPKMKDYIESIYCKEPTLEEVKQEWEALGYKWIRNGDFIELLNEVKEELFIIDIKNKKYVKTDDKVKFTLYITFQEHQLLTKIFRASGGLNVRKITTTVR